MKRKGMHLIGLILLLAAPATAVTVPADLPAIDVQTSPRIPAADQEFRLSLSGRWPDSCTPNLLDVRVFPADSIWVDLLLPGAQDCDEPSCAQVISFFEVNNVVGPVVPGTYDVFARAVACDRSGGFEHIGTIRVGMPADGDDDPSPPPPPARRRLAPGDRVTLLESDPPGFQALQAGRAGTVVCCDTLDCSGMVFVSWDFFEFGVDTPRRCADGTPVLFPPGSGRWIDPTITPLGTPFDQCGIIQEGLEGCIVFEAEDGRLYNVVDRGGWLSEQLGRRGAIEFGDRVRIRALLNPIPRPNIIRICLLQSGDLFHPQITLCEPVERPGCCNAGFQPGDQVVLLVNDPQGMDGQTPSGLPAGAIGTVVCCDLDDPQLPVFVSWEDFTKGSNADQFCDPPIAEYPADSGLWMRCDQIALLDRDNGEPGPCPDDELVIDIGGNRIRLKRDPDCPAPARSFSGCTDVTLEANFRARLSVRVTPSERVNGTWEGWVTPEVIEPGTSTVRVCVRATDIDVTALPPGKNVSVARVSIFAVPAQR